MWCGYGCIWVRVYACILAATSKTYCPTQWIRDYTHLEQEKTCFQQKRGETEPK